MAPTDEGASRRGLNRDISRTLVAQFKEATGRGPTYSRTYKHDNLVVTVLHDTMTRGEQTLKDERQQDVVRDLRRLFQGALRDDAVAAVERLTGRKVLAFLSDHAVDSDYAVEVFVLEPGLGDDSNQLDR
jgi:uncharacterized protein YbcI